MFGVGIGLSVEIFAYAIVACLKNQSEVSLSLSNFSIVVGGR